MSSSIIQNQARRYTYCGGYGAGASNNNISPGDQKQEYLTNKENLNYINDKQYHNSVADNSRSKRSSSSYNQNITSNSNNGETIARNNRSSYMRRKQLTFGPYVVGSTLGEGEFGKVKLAWTKASLALKQVDNNGNTVSTKNSIPKQVAIKLIKRDSIPPGSEKETKIFREINALKHLTHPNIVHLEEVLQNSKYVGIVLEYASGGEFYRYIQRRKRLKEPQACRLFAQLISGVHYMHSKGLVHRDLKLENLLLDKYENLIITDFGFVNEFVPGYNELMKTSCGSPCYAAPELVVSSRPYLARKADVWSCGIILFAMLAGYLPWDDDPTNPDGDDIAKLYMYITQTPLKFPEYIAPIPRDLLRRILVSHPKHRLGIKQIEQHPWLQPHLPFLSVSPEEWDKAMSDNKIFRPPKSTKKNVRPRSTCSTSSNGERNSLVLDGSYNPQPLPPQESHTFATTNDNTTQHTGTTGDKNANNNESSGLEESTDITNSQNKRTINSEKNNKNTFTHENTNSDGNSGINNNAYNTSDINTIAITTKNTANDTRENSNGHTANDITISPVLDVKLKVQHKSNNVLNNSSATDLLNDSATKDAALSHPRRHKRNDSAASAVLQAVYDAVEQQRKSFIVQNNQTYDSLPLYSSATPNKTSKSSLHNNNNNNNNNDNIDKHIVTNKHGRKFADGNTSSSSSNVKFNSVPHRKPRPTSYQPASTTVSFSSFEFPSSGFVTKDTEGLNKPNKNNKDTEGSNTIVSINDVNGNKINGSGSVKVNHGSIIKEEDEEEESTREEKTPKELNKNSSVPSAKQPHRSVSSNTRTSSNGVRQGSNTSASGGSPNIPQQRKISTNSTETRKSKRFSFLSFYSLYNNSKTSIEDTESESIKRKSVSNDDKFSTTPVVNSAGNSSASSTPNPNNRHSMFISKQSNDSTSEYNSNANLKKLPSSSKRRPSTRNSIAVSQLPNSSFTSSSNHTGGIYGNKSRRNASGQTLLRKF
ncbi:uncharacterized protein SCODWIG_02650 [Saccharomycodes ludwigii]|uniref:non-specific serine/threonine protein kinase n=1 Tax=Saccharomycodes ludwigii TaxID=36035 RepID=A0A376B8K4_9ASCO|nr:uncharacterized protein SCODWIG_02650 [Saccharomycodes ludwigii]